VNNILKERISCSLNKSVLKPDPYHSDWINGIEDSVKKDVVYWHILLWWCLGTGRIAIR